MVMMVGVAGGSRDSDYDDDNAVLPASLHSLNESTISYLVKWQSRRNHKPLIPTYPLLKYPQPTKCTINASQNVNRIIDGFWIVSLTPAPTYLPTLPTHTDLSTYLPPIHLPGHLPIHVSAYLPTYLLTNLPTTLSSLSLYATKRIQRTPFTSMTGPSFGTPPPNSFPP